MSKRAPAFAACIGMAIIYCVFCVYCFRDSLSSESGEKLRAHLIETRAKSADWVDMQRDLWKRYTADVERISKIKDHAVAEPKLETLVRELRIYKDERFSNEEARLRMSGELTEEMLTVFTTEKRAEFYLLPIIGVICMVILAFGSLALFRETKDNVTPPVFRETTDNSTPPDQGIEAKSS